MCYDGNKIPVHISFRRCLYDGWKASGHAGTHFLEFAFSFLTFAKCQYQSANHIKINSLPFFTLSVLADQKDENYTMSDLADKLQITKQQLSKLINDLEDKRW